MFYTALALYTIIATILVLEKGLHPLMVFAVSYAMGFTYNIIFQIRNILDNKTIIERKVGYKAGLEFGKRTKLQNWEFIFGTNKLLWFLPIKTMSVISTIDHHSRIQPAGFLNSDYAFYQKGFKVTALDEYCSGSEEEEE